MSEYLDKALSISRKNGGTLCCGDCLKVLKSLDSKIEIKNVINDYECTCMNMKFKLDRGLKCFFCGFYQCPSHMSNIIVCGAKKEENLYSFDDFIGKMYSAK